MRNYFVVDFLNLLSLDDYNAKYFIIYIKEYIWVRWFPVIGKKKKDFQ